MQKEKKQSTKPTLLLSHGFIHSAESFKNADSFINIDLHSYLNYFLWREVSKI